MSSPVTTSKVASALHSRSLSKTNIAKHRSLNLKDYEFQFEAVVESESVRQLVFQQLKAHMNEETIEFFQAVQTFKQHNSVHDLKYIYRTFIANSSPKEINISTVVRSRFFFTLVLISY
jgi:hypothetical protein